MQNNQLSIINSIKFAFSSLWHNKLICLKVLLFNMLFGALVVVCVINACFVLLFFLVLGSSQGRVVDPSTLHEIVFRFVQQNPTFAQSPYVWLLAGLCVLGLLVLAFYFFCIGWFGTSRVALDLYDRSASSLSSYFSVRHLFGRLLKFFVPMVLLVCAGLGLSLYLLSKFPPVLEWMIVIVVAVVVLPILLFFWIRFALWGFIFVDTKVSVSQASTTSFELTKGHWLRLFGLTLVYVVAGALLGKIPGISELYQIIAIFLVKLSFVYAYRTLQGKPRQVTSSQTVV